VGQNGIVEGDVGLLGIEQDPVAIKGYQLEQIVDPIGAAKPFCPAVSSPGAESAKSFIKNIILTDLSQLSMLFEKKGQAWGATNVPGTFPGSSSWALSSPAKHEKTGGADFTASARERCGGHGPPPWVAQASSLCAAPARIRRRQKLFKAGAHSPQARP
jgi:hypothetical protein